MAREVTGVVVGVGVGGCVDPELNVFEPMPPALIPSIY